MSKSDISKEEFIRVGTTLYKLVNQPRLNGGYVKKRIVWNNETLRQDYGKHYLATVPKYVRMYERNRYDGEGECLNVEALSENVDIK